MIVKLVQQRWALAGAVIWARCFRQT